MILGRINANGYWDRPQRYRDDVCAWLRANGIDPNKAAVEDIEVVLIDAPAIARTEYVTDSQGRKQIDYPADPVKVRRVHSLLREPLPTHLNDWPQQ